MRRQSRRHDAQAWRASFAAGVFGALAWGAPARADCHSVMFPTTGIDLRRSLQTQIRDIGITGFGRTQPYRDSTVSIFIGSDVGLVLREQDDLVIEIGVELPLPAEPLEIAKFNALSARLASRFSGEDETKLRARLLDELLAHSANGPWAETSAGVTLDYARAPQSLIVKMHRQKCD
ncbi:hypothetical protein M8523_06750 [Hyphomicrobiales bacterium BP6-180914]|uniref:Uncharacterized protein n=2 Tax=Lichenifustis flavocetrariae TaxID=2949735 RepID=A0AA41YV14_9HYPH|nr:hypothetical protein [Lichenifustis flavocetrariae]